jgi:hypothetical protein
MGWGVTRNLRPTSGPMGEAAKSGVKTLGPLRQRRAAKARWASSPCRFEQANRSTVSGNDVLFGALAGSAAELSRVQEPRWATASKAAAALAVRGGRWFRVPYPIERQWWAGCDRQGCGTSFSDLASPAEHGHRCGVSVVARASAPNRVHADGGGDGRQGLAAPASAIPPYRPGTRALIAANVRRALAQPERPRFGLRGAAGRGFRLPKPLRSCDPDCR